MSPDILIAQSVYDRAHAAALLWARTRSGDCHMGVSDLEFDWRNSLIRFNDRPSGGGVAMRTKWSIPLSFVDEDSATIAADAKTRRDVETAEAIKKSDRVNELRNSAPVLELGRLGYVMEPYQPRFIL